MNYSYLADGTKLSSLDDDGDGLLYRGSLIYRKTDGEVELESILFEGGRFVPNGGPMLHVTDHLGSVRAVVNALSGEVTETSDYFPFGMRMDIWGAVEDESNRYRFNGKEDQEGEFGVPTLDYGARHYSATSARWLSMDPLAEKYYGVSPYAFCNNDPVNFVDLDGAAWGKAVKVVKKVYKTVKTGNKLSVKNILKSEVLDIADNVHTLFDSDASGFEKGIAAFDLATGFGDEAKWLAKTVGISDGIVDGAKIFNGQSDTFSETASQAFRKAKDQNGIPRSQQPSRTMKPNTEVGNSAGLKNKNIIQYEFTNSKGEKVIIRQDKAITYPDGGYQPPHYNAGKADDNKLKQHHYYE